MTTDDDQGCALVLAPKMEPGLDHSAITRQCMVVPNEHLFASGLVGRIKSTEARATTQRSTDF